MDYVIAKMKWGGGLNYSIKDMVLIVEQIKNCSHPTSKLRRRKPDSYDLEHIPTCFKESIKNCFKQSTDREPEKLWNELNWVIIG